MQSFIKILLLVLPEGKKLWVIAALGKTIWLISR